MRKGYYFLFAVLVSISPAFAETTNSLANNNNWTNAVAWSEGHVPTGTETAEIQAGVTVDGNTTIASDYSGNLILRAGAVLYVLDRDRDYRDFLPSDTNSTISLYDGAKLYVRYGSIGPMYHPLLIDGAVTIEKGTYYNANSWSISSVISGAGSLTWSFFQDSTHNNREIFFTPASPCTYTGGTTIQNLNSTAQSLRVYADGAFGTGDVTIKTASQVVLSGTSDVIDDSAGLYIEGTGILNLGSNSETIHHCYIDGVKQPDGDYTSAESWLLGSGTLTVEGPPSGTVFTVN
jgi:hypothetical protein